MATPYSVWRQYFLPQHSLSRFAGYLANHEYPPLKNYLIKYFLKRHSVNMSEAQEENPFEYKSFNHFFTRALKPQERPLSQQPLDIISPADGKLYQFGKITNNTLLHAKNQCYNLHNLLGSKDDLSMTFIDGHYYCVYLAPHDYHRVHIPADGELVKMRYIPGRLFSVNKASSEHIENIFARNERVVAFFNGPHGKFVVILVGAMIVGSIHTSWAGKIQSENREILERDYSTHPICILKGNEIGHFELGSTVITLFEKNIKIDEKLDHEQPIKMGHTIGQFLS